MESFAMEIARVVIGVEPMFQSTREYCKPYLTDKEPNHFIHVSTDNLVAEQLILEWEAVEQGIKPRKFKDPFLERATIQRQAADYLINCNALMLHGSTVAVDGRAYLFTAPCGTGKSTHTRLWRELFGERAVMVNDDKPFLKVTSAGVFAYGSPWCGKHGLATNICVPLQGICCLHRGEDNRIIAAESYDVVGILRDQAHSPADGVLLERSYELLDHIVQTVPLWQMWCNMDLEAASVSYNAMRSK